MTVPSYTPLRHFTDEEAEALRLEVVAALDVLPRQADSVAAFLFERNHLGDVNSLWTCPLAWYVRKTVPDAGVPIVRHDRPLRIMRLGERGDCRLRPGVRHFLRFFDEGRYPFLVAQPVRFPDAGARDRALALAYAAQRASA